MKKVLFWAIAMLAPAAVIAASLEIDDRANVIQAPAWNGGKVRVITAVPRGNTVDMSQDVAYSVYCAAASYERAMAKNYSTALRTTYTMTPIPQATWQTTTVNKATPFINFTGCAGWVKRQ